MKKILSLMLVLVAVLSCMASCGKKSEEKEVHYHTAIDATCLEPAKCKDCGYVMGTDLADHTLEGVVCTVCGWNAFEELNDLITNSDEELVKKSYLIIAGENTNNNIIRVFVNTTINDQKWTQQGFEITADSMKSGKYNWFHRTVELKNDDGWEHWDETSRVDGTFEAKTFTKEAILSHNNVVGYTESEVVELNKEVPKAIDSILINILSPVLENSEYGLDLVSLGFESYAIAQ